MTTIVPRGDPRLDLGLEAERWLVSQWPWLRPPTDPYAPDDGWPITARGTRATVQVRHTERYHGQLLQRADDDHWSDYYVLVVGSAGDFSIAGWTIGERLREHWDPALPKPAWAMPQRYLKKPEKFYEELFGMRLWK